jgi:hypothetical protein
MTVPGTPASPDWPDELLDRMTHTADPLADNAVAALFKRGSIEAGNELFNHLLMNEELLPPDAPAELQAYLAQSAQFPSWTDYELVRQAEVFFERNGPFCLVALLCASLPECYALKNEAAVLATTMQLEQHTYRRVLETTQLVVAVMREGGMRSPGEGIKAVQKVRLLHATIRHLILSPRPSAKPAASPKSFGEAVARSRAWDPATAGQPINQEEIAYTLLTFSYVILRSFDRLGIHVTPEEQKAFFHCWNVVGSLMGVREELLTFRFEDGARLFSRIKARRMSVSDEGRDLTRALTRISIEIIQHETDGLVPRLFVKRLPAVIMRLLLDKPTRKTLRVRWLGPGEWLLLGLFRLLVAVSNAGYECVLGFGGTRFATAILLRLTKFSRGRRPLFALPEHLAKAWSEQRPWPRRRLTES